MPKQAEPVVLNSKQVARLKAIATSRDSGQQLKCRALIVLLLGKGLSNKEVAQQLNVAVMTVHTWRSRWAGNNEDATISDHGKPVGAKTTVLTPEFIEAVETKALEQRPGGGCWSVRSLAKELNVSANSMSNALRKLKISFNIEGKHKLRDDRVNIAALGISVDQANEMRLLTSSTNATSLKRQLEVLLAINGGDQQSAIAQRLGVTKQAVSLIKKKWLNCSSLDDFIARSQ